MHFLLWTKGSYQSPILTLPSVPFSKPQVSFSSNFAWPFNVIKDIPLYFFRSNFIHFAQKAPIKVHIFETIECSDQNSPNSCHFSNKKSIFLQILHHSSEIIALYFFSWNFKCFQQKEPIKVQIWWSFTWAVESLKFCTLLSSFCPNKVKFQLKSTEELSLIALKSDGNKEKLTFSFKYDTKNLVNFHPTTQKSENFTLMGFFCPKYIRFELKEYRGAIFHDIEQWCKIWTNPDLVFWKITWGIGWTFIRAFESLKNYTLMGSFCPKHIMFQLKHFRGTMCHETER